MESGLWYSTKGLNYFEHFVWWRVYLLRCSDVYVTLERHFGLDVRLKDVSNESTCVLRGGKCGQDELLWEPFNRWCLYCDSICLIISVVLRRQSASVASSVVLRLVVFYELSSKYTNVLRNLGYVSRFECPIGHQPRYLLQSRASKRFAVYNLSLLTPDLVVLHYSKHVATWTYISRGMTVNTQQQWEWLHTCRPEHSASMI